MGQLNQIDSFTQDRGRDRAQPRQPVDRASLRQGDPAVLAEASASGQEVQCSHRAATSLALLRPVRLSASAPDCRLKLAGQFYHVVTARVTTAGLAEPIAGLQAAWLLMAPRHRGCD